MLEFDLAKLLGAAEAAHVIPVDYDMNQKTLMFIINVSLTLEIMHRASASTRARWSSVTAFTTSSRAAS